MKNIVVFGGAGISAESGLKTFRAADGLWEEHRLEDVATPGAWQRDQDMVLRFYNERRRTVVTAQPNAAHLALAALDQHANVQIITQNIDDLHERAGSKNVLHLHGEIMLARSSIDETLLYDTHGKDIQSGDFCEKRSQLRPHVVWFGEAVPLFEPAAALVERADIFLVVGTSLAVYPAASLLQFVRPDAEKYIVTLDLAETPRRDFVWLKEKASTGVPALVAEWINPPFD
ncbi:MAG: silent information regulator protein Sir2 [Verrucomicrobiaceae bacterium]|nr:silent information regulator protein Sir2 [Verrucomicrobiaceae bacterium]